MNPTGMEDVVRFYRSRSSGARYVAGRRRERAAA